MSLDKVVDSAMLDAGMVIVADAIRAKAGITIYFIKRHQ